MRRPALGRPCRECIAGFLVFLLISMLMLVGAGAPLEDGILRAIGAARTDAMTAIMHGASLLGDGAIEIPIAVVLLVLIWRVSGRPTGLRYLYCALSGELVYVIAKATFQRPRPDIIPRLGSAGWHSYPSGHAMLAPIIYGVALILLARAVTNRFWRGVLIGAAVLIPVAIALSRVYLGVHYPSDVLGALALGSAWGYLWFGSSRSASCATASAPATS